MNKYDVQIEQLKVEWDVAGKKYAAEAQQINNVAMQYCNQFNSQITIVNVERHLMRREINALYKFLKHFGDVGARLSPCDFVAEDWLFPGSQSVRHDKAGNGAKKQASEWNVNTMLGATTAGVAAVGASTATGVLGVSALAGSASIAASAATVGMALPLFAPVALPAYMLISEFKKKSDSKEELMKLEKDYRQDVNRWKNDLGKMQDEVSFLISAVQIANMYRSLVAVVRDTIADKILPELNGILAFLYADAIKNCIINNEDPGTATLPCISEYRGTPYEGHYQFIKNTFEYYTLISTFFTQPILSNLLETRKVSSADLNRFKKQIDSIENQRQKLVSGCIIGGDLR